MKLTLSVRVLPGAGDLRHLPPDRRAWPFGTGPRRATRVTSEAKELSWSTMVLMVFFSSRISPRHVRR